MQRAKGSILSDGGVEQRLLMVVGARARSLFEACRMGPYVRQGVVVFLGGVLGVAVGEFVEGLMKSVLILYVGTHAGSVVVGDRRELVVPFVVPVRAVGHGVVA